MDRNVLRMRPSAITLLLLAVFPIGCAEKSPVAENCVCGVQGASQECLICAPAAGAPAAAPPALNSRSTAAWVAELRKGPVEELTAAGEKAAPLLVAAIQDPEAATWVLHMLAFAPKDQNREWTIPVYAAGLKNPDATTRWRVLMALSEFGPSVPRAAPSIGKDLLALCQRDADRADDVLRLLEKIELPPQDALPLLRVLYDAETDPMTGPFTRQAVVRAMARSSPEAVPALVELIATTESDYGTWGLRDVQPEMLAPLAEFLDHEDPARRRAAAWILARQDQSQSVQPWDQEILGTLLNHLDDSDGFVREYLLEMFEGRPPQTEHAVPALVARFSDEHGANGHRAARALANMGPLGLPAVRQEASSEDARRRLGAAVALGALKPVPESEIPLLVALAGDPDAEVRRYAVYGLQHTGDARPDVLSALTAALEDSETASWAVRALGALGPPAAPALPQLIEQLPTAEPGDRVGLATAIWRIDASSPLVIPALLEVLKDTQTRRGGYYASTRMVEGKRVETTGPLKEPVASAAAEALGAMGPAAAPAVKALLDAAKQDSSLAGDAIRALGQIGPAAREAVPTLVEIANSQSMHKDWADYALRAIAPEAAQGQPRIGRAVPAATSSSYQAAPYSGPTP